MAALFDESPNPFFSLCLAYFGFVRPAPGLRCPFPGFDPLFERFCPQLSCPFASFDSPFDVHVLPSLSLKAPSTLQETQLPC